MEYAQQTRAMPRTVAKAIELFAKVADGDRHSLTCYFRNGQAIVERRDGKPFRTKAAVAAVGVEMRRAREKVARVRDAGSRPYSDAMAKVARYKALANDAWNG